MQILRSPRLAARAPVRIMCCGGSFLLLLLVYGQQCSAKLAVMMAPLDPFASRRVMRPPPRGMNRCHQSSFKERPYRTST